MNGNKLWAVKYIAFCVFVFSLFYSYEGKAQWENYQNIEQQITKTWFPDSEFSIIDYGAISDNEEVLSHKAINAAIIACYQAGGGKVIIPKGTFYTGPITLKSNVNLHFEDGATLKFSTDSSLYFPQVLTRWEGVDCYNIRPLIYAYGETNIAITGKGVIDGQASNENWWYMCGATKFGWKEGMISQRTGRPKLLKANETFLPMNERIMSMEDALRPQLINIYNCSRVLIEDVTLLNSPFWVVHPVFCESFILRNVNIKSHGPNSDGCDPESSKNVLIENCKFDTGDDCIAIKSGRNADGRKWNIPSENIIVRNCEMLDGHGGVVVGSEISGGYKNLFVENCIMDSPNLDRVIRIKTSNCRGGTIENIFVRNITVGQCKEAVLKINLKYENREDCDRSFPPFVRNVKLENVTSNKSKYGLLLTGLEESVNIENISINNCKFDNVSGGNKITGANDVHFSDFYVNGKKVKP